MKIDAKFIARGALIAATYAAVTILLAPISYGPIQVRVSEALTSLAYFDPAAIPGLYIGAVLANWYGGIGILDIVFGALFTLIAAILTYLIALFFRRYSHKIFIYLGPLVALLPVVLINAFGVAYILKIALQLKEAYILIALSVGIGEAIAVYILGYPLLLLVHRLQIYE